MNICEKTIATKRNMSIEAIRIIAMLMIIIEHAIGHNYLVENIPTDNPTHYAISFMQVVCYVATNVYVLISAYFFMHIKIQSQKNCSTVVPNFFLLCFRQQILVWAEKAQVCLRNSLYFPCCLQRFLFSSSL